MNLLQYTVEDIRKSLSPVDAKDIIENLSDGMWDGMSAEDKQVLTDILIEIQKDIDQAA